MFRHTETLLLFGLAAVQTVVFSKTFQGHFQLGGSSSLVMGVILAFVVSGIEVWIIAKWLNR